MGDHPPRTRKDQAPDSRKPSLAASTACRIISITEDPEPPFREPAICLNSSDDGHALRCGAGANTAMLEARPQGKHETQPKISTGQGRDPHRQPCWSRLVGSNERR